MSSRASGRAADQQQESTREATELQREQYGQARADAQPWTQTGVDSLNLLRQRLGMGGVAQPVNLQQQAQQQAQAAEQQRMAGLSQQDQMASLRQELLPQFTTTGPSTFQMTTGDNPGGVMQGAETVNEAGLNAAIQSRMQAQQAGVAAAGGGMNDIVGEGMRPQLGGAGQPGQMADPRMAGGGVNNPTEQGFQAPRDRVTQAQSALAGVGNRLTDAQARPTSPDVLMQMDPGYQFRLQQGQQALERSAAARGGLLSGRAMKDTLDFGSGLASQEYGAAFQRQMGLDAREWEQGMSLDTRDYGRALTDANRAWDQNATLDNRDYSRAWDLDQSGYNRLASLAGIGNSSQQNTSALGANFSQQAGANMIGAGNAAAAGTVGQANAWNQAIGQGINQLQTNRLYDIYSQGRAGQQPQNRTLMDSGYYGGN